MAKKNFGSKPLLLPFPVTIVGAEVDGKPNFMAIGYIGIIDDTPSMVALGSLKTHYTNRGIIENKTFSVNIPSEEMIQITDYVGVVSGEKTDKSKLFDVFYGKLKNAPMIQQCPLNLECKVLDILEKGGTYYNIIGEIVESYVDEECMVGKYPDLEKVKPMVFSVVGGKYYSVGKYLGAMGKASKDFKYNGREQ
ncbi:MAG: flavin reductase family protein [Promethearchaeati archaeon SRVP18_Atabeyarchaeia-1]